MTAPTNQRKARRVTARSRHKNFKVKLPTKAQAECIASIWAREAKTITVGSFNSATERVLIKNGWLTANGQTRWCGIGGQVPVYELTDKAIDALAAYLTDQRWQRKRRALLETTMADHG